MHEQNIICTQTRLDDIAREQAIICRQLFAGLGGYSHTLPIRVCAAQWGCDFEATGLEQVIHFRGIS